MKQRMLIAFCISFLAAPAVLAFAAIQPHTGSILNDRASNHGRIYLSAASTKIADQSIAGYENPWPNGDALDRRILNIAMPATLNLAIVPLVGAADTFWVGKMANALALAGQGAANQMFNSAFWIASFLPSIVTPLVAKAAAAGDQEGIQNRVGEAIFLATLMGIFCTTMLSLYPHKALNLVLAADAGSRVYAVEYLSKRSISLIPALLSTVGFAAFRGTMDVITPLKISLLSNIINCILDPIFIFSLKLGAGGAAVATVVAEFASLLLYIRALVSKKMLNIAKMLKPPSLVALKPLLLGGIGVQLRAVSLNVAFLAVTKATQALDTTGTAAAAHSITVQLWQLGGVFLLAMSVTASIIVPQERFKKDSSSILRARQVANRMLRWGFVMGVLLGCVQLLCLPLLNIFSPLKEVQKAARLPSIIGAALQLLNGVVFVGEGIQQGNQAFVELAAATACASLGMVVSLRLFGSTLAGVWGSFAVFNGIRLIGVLRHHFVSGPLVIRNKESQNER